MSDIPARLRDLVIERGGGRCEYCRLAQAGQEATFHIDHVLPRIDGGPTEEHNLALACVSCSLRKAAKRDGIDPESAARVGLFNPRTQVWHEHFRWEAEWIVGLTPTGRATIAQLDLNRPLILGIRREETQRGRHPPE